MAVAAAVTQYREEHIAAFEQNYSILRATCVTHAQIKGNSAVFLVSGSGGATAVTRGTNGLIPYGQTTNTQSTCTLLEKHAPFEMTGFNIFASQGDQRRIMQETTMAVLNRKVDDDIIAQLDTATNDTGTAVKPSLEMVVWAKTILGNNFVDLSDEDNLFGLISPAFEGYMMQITEFASADYVDVKPFNGPTKKFRRWMGLNWITHSRLTNSIGAGGTSTSEQCYLFHRNAIGHAVNKPGLDVKVGYDEEQDYSYARVSGYFGSKLLQNSGVAMMKADGSAYAAA